MKWILISLGSRFKRERVASIILLTGILFGGSFWHHGRWNWFPHDEIGRYAMEVSRPCCVEAQVVSEPLWVVADATFGIRPEMKMKTRLVLKVSRLRDGLDWVDVGGVCDLVIHQSVNGIHPGIESRYWVT